MKNILRRIPASIEGKLLDRKEPCRMCGEQQGIHVAVLDYWDISTANLVKCPKCALAQLDPMLNDAETAKGCFAYYIEETLRTSQEEQLKNCVRNYRRGVVFGRSLKAKGISPRNVLELGPGSGYFCDGLRFVFPALKVAVIDINQELLTFNLEHHGYSGYLEVPDNLVPECVGRSDLVIARDIIEHVSDISKVVVNVNKYLVPGGHFHFITPNGHEDLWKHYLTHTVAKEHSELLINHVNYFDGRGLKEFLGQKGFTPVDYYTYQLKSTMRGKGWKNAPKLMSRVSRKLDAGMLISEKAKEIAQEGFSIKALLEKWYISQQAKWLTYLYSAYQHDHWVRMDPELNVGHEIYGLFRKTA